MLEKKSLQSRNVALQPKSQLIFSVNIKKIAIFPSIFIEIYISQLFTVSHFAISDS